MKVIHLSVIERKKINKKYLYSEKKVINEKTTNYKIKDNKYLGICTLINSNNDFDYNNNYFNNKKEETDKLEHFDNILEMKSNNINNFEINDFNNYIDFKENYIINFDKNKNKNINININKESLINTNEYEFDGKSNISNKENDIDSNDNYLINNNEQIEFSDIDNYENQISNNQHEDTNLEALSSNLWDTFEVINRFI
jgi:hypothetical protein